MLIDPINRKLAGELTRKNFGIKRELFNPLYVSDVCVNDCSYCSFRISNRDLHRKTLTTSEALIEAEFILSRGVGGILLLAGEFGLHSYTRLFYEIVCAIRERYPDIWIGLESAPLNEKHYKQLVNAGVDSVIHFQETYSRSRYLDVHKGVGPKSDYDFRLNSLARAVESGVKEVGLGVLLGLDDVDVDIDKMHRHAEQLIEINPLINLRFSFPRIRKFSGGNFGDFVDISDSEMIRAIVDTRIRFPNSRIVLTARESQAFRLSLSDIVTDFGEAGSTAVGGYAVNASLNRIGQFELPGIGSIKLFKKLLRQEGLELD